MQDCAELEKDLSEDNEMSEPQMLYRIEGHIAVLTLNRPEAKNAFSPEMLTLWRQFLEEAKADIGEK